MQKSKKRNGIVLVVMPKTICVGTWDTRVTKWSPLRILQSHLFPCTLAQRMWLGYQSTREGKSNWNYGITYH